jgi:hypothetical protein
MLLFRDFFERMLRAASAGRGKQVVDKDFIRDMNRALSFDPNSWDFFADFRLYRQSNPKLRDDSRRLGRQDPKWQQSDRITKDAMAVHEKELSGKRRTGSSFA